MRDVMIDIETFGNGKCASIVQIGACFFDRKTGEIGQTFKANVDSASNGDLDASTVYWWLEQSPEAIKSILAEPREPCLHVLHRLNTFLEKADAIWSHATFDFVIIMEAFKAFAIKPLFSYRCARDIRTLIDLAGTPGSKHLRSGVHHDGLDDAKFQVAYCVEALRVLSK